MHTCYSPVRRSPAAVASYGPAAPRLACVKPVASVHPEPGSNSPLFISCSFLFLKMSLGPLRPAGARHQSVLLPFAPAPENPPRALIGSRWSFVCGTDKGLTFSCSVSCTFSVSIISMSLDSTAISVGGNLCKGRAKNPNVQILFNHLTSFNFIHLFWPFPLKSECKISHYI